MLYTLSDRIMPSFYQNFNKRNFAIIHRNINPISNHVITALHYHSCLELGICVSGKGTTYIDNRVYSYRQGDMQVVPPGIPHLSRSESDPRAQWHWISLEPLRLLNSSQICFYDDFEKMAKDSYCGVFHPWEHPRLAELINWAGEIDLDNGVTTEIEATMLAGQLLVECARIGNVDHTDGTLAGRQSKIMPAVLYIRSNYADKEAMREEAVAGTCDMSVSHFRAVFKRETGLTVRDFIIQTRLVAAAYMLQHTNDSVMSIALESGFGQISCFNRIFSRVFGEPPTSFRKRSRQDRGRR